MIYKMHNSPNKLPDNMIDITPGDLSPYSKNTTLEWLNTDSEEAYIKNMKRYKTYTKLKEAGYVVGEDNYSGPITYSFDKLGFRNDVNVIWARSFLALGCSYTVGIGLHVHETWPFLLAQKLLIPSYNAGVSGTGPDTHFRIARVLVPAYKPKAVFALSSFANRFEIISDFKHNNTPATIFPIHATNRDYGDLGRIVFTDESMQLQKERNLLAIDQICVDNNIPFVYIDLDESKKLISGMSNARDISHAGKAEQQIIANTFFEKYREIE